MLSESDAAGSTNDQFCIGGLLKVLFHIFQFPFQPASSLSQLDNVCSRYCTLPRGVVIYAMGVGAIARAAFWDPRIAFGFALHEPLVNSFATQESLKNSAYQWRTCLHLVHAANVCAIRPSKLGLDSSGALDGEVSHGFVNCGCIEVDSNRDAMMV